MVVGFGPVRGGGVKERHGVWRMVRRGMGA